MAFIASLWLFMVVSSVCALVAAWYARSGVRDFGSIAWAIFVMVFVWAVANVLWLMLMGSFFGEY